MNRLLATALLAALATPALAQSHAQRVHEHFTFDYPLLASAEDAHASADAWKRWADDFSRDMRASMGTMFGHRLGPHQLVKGAPYSAEVVTETRQTLADGNVISRKSTGAVYRDGEGRTRQESGGDGKEPSVFILDPVEGKHYVVMPGGKARVTNVPLAGKRDGTRERQVVRVNGTEVRVENGKVFVDGKEAPAGRVETTSHGKTIVVDNGRITIDGKEVGAPPTPPTPGSPTSSSASRQVIVKHIDRGDGTEREEVRVQVIRPDGDMIPLPPPPPTPPGAPGAAPVPPVPPLPPMPGVQTLRFESTARLGKGVTTNLGMKDFDGVKAEGKSTVWVIPAGEIGNKNPIQVTSESWYAPDLKVTVSSRYNDPRTGETTYRLANIRRGEPPADLFKVPEEALGKSRAKVKEKG